jgi:hypothetical protein
MTAAKTKTESNRGGRSTGEQRFLDCWHKYGIPESDPIEQWESDELRSPVSNRKYKWDFAWPKSRLLIEVHGVGGHHTIAGVSRDAQKQRVALAGGYTVIPVTTACLTSEAKREAVCCEIEQIVMACGRWTNGDEQQGANQ